MWDWVSHPYSAKIDEVMFSRLIERRLRMRVQAQYKSVRQYWHMAVTAVATVHIGNSVHWYIDNEDLNRTVPQYWRIPQMCHVIIIW